MAQAKENRIHFTKSKIEGLPLPEPGKRAVYWDDEVKVLALRITDKGARSFYVVRRVKGGAPEWLKIGPFPEVTVEQARREAMEKGAKLATGESIAAKRRQERKDHTFQELYAWWVKLPGKNGDRSEAYVRETERQMKTYLGDLAKRKASKISRSDVRHLHEELSSKHGRYVANRVLALIRAVYNKAIGNEKIVCANPAEGVEANPEQSRERRLLPGEISGFLNAVAAEPNEDIRDYVLLSLYTGARKSNVLGMRWEDLDLKGRTWSLATTKNGRPQVLPLLAAEIEILERRRLAQTPESSDKPETKWVFPGPGKTGHLVFPRKGWVRILVRAGLADPEDSKARTKKRKKGEPKTETPARAKERIQRKYLDLRLHDLRRTFGSFMADSGASLNIIGKALNHLSPQATTIYARLALDPVRQAKEAGIALMLGAANGR